MLKPKYVLRKYLSKCVVRGKFRLRKRNYMLLNCQVLAKLISRDEYNENFYTSKLKKNAQVI